MSNITKRNNSKNIVKIVLSGLFIALGIVLPFLTGQIPEIGSRLSPMHIPVLLCGFVCGWPYGLIVGFITPLFRSMLTGMPPFPVTAVPMAFELAVYGIIAGVLYKKLPKKTPYIYVSLISAMIGGRIVWGVVRSVMLVQGVDFSIQMFIAGAFVNAIPGIILHIALIPLIVIALKRANLIQNN